MPRRTFLILVLLALALVRPAPATLADDDPVDGGPAEDVGATSSDDAPSADGALDREPVRNNIFGLNVARLHQEKYIWAASDLVNANGGDWGYVTAVWTAEDRDDPKADLNLQVFLDRCFYFHVQPIIRVATRYDGKHDTWDRPAPDEPAKWRAFFERATWPTRRVWVIAGNEPNLGREWGGVVDGGDYARYLARFLDAFEGSDRFKVVNAPLDASNGTELPAMQDAYAFLDDMREAVPNVFERLGAWASNPYRVISGGDGLRYTHRAYEAELEHIGREMPVLIAEAGHLETGDEQEIATFYRESFRDWTADPRVVAVTPLFWHPDRGEYWMFELDRRGAMIYRSPTYLMLRELPRVAGSPQYAPELANAPAPPRLVVAGDEPPDAESRPDARAAPAATSPHIRPSNVPPRNGSQEDALGSTAAAGVDDALSEVAPDRAARRTVGNGSSEVTSGASAGRTIGTPAGQGETTRRAVGQSGGATSEMLRVIDTGSSGANLRAAPATSAPLVAVVADGSRLVAAGPEERADGPIWRSVRTPDGLDGWIAAELVERVPTRADPRPAFAPVVRPTAPGTQPDAPVPASPEADALE